MTEASEIDIEAIAYHVGAIIKYRPLDGCEGRIIGVKNRAVITVNSSAIFTRQRFSAAHELGHWQHHRGQTLVCRSDGTQKLVIWSPRDPEHVADVYAANLLMPGFLFSPMAKQVGRVSFQAVEELRQNFRTSITATAVRLVEYGCESAMLVCHGAGGRKWFYRSDDIPRRWFPRSTLDAESYAIEVLQGRTVYTSRELASADAWFDYPDAEQHGLYEETRRIGDDEILTLLVFKDEEMLD